MKTAALVEEGYESSGVPRIRYWLLGEVIADFPDDRSPVVREVVAEIRAKSHLGFVEAYAIWKAREIKFV